MWREYYMYQCVCLKYWYRKWNSSFFLCFEFYLQTSNIMRTQNWINLNPKATLHLLIKWYPYQRQCIIQQFQIISVKSIFLNQHHTFYKKRKILWYILYRDTNIVKSILKNWENSISSQVWKWDTIIYSFSFDLNFDFRIVKLGI